MMTNPFLILNVTPESSQDEIKQSYRNFVKLYHPDVYQGNKDAATEKMQELNWAFEILSDPIKRQKYEEEYYEILKKEHKQCDSENTDSQTNERKVDKENSNKPNRKIIITIILIIVTVFLIVIIPKSCNSNNSNTDSNYDSNYSDEDYENSTTVYITDSGSKYHRASCSYLSNSKHEISLKKAVKKGYTRCTRCKPPKYND